MRSARALNPDVAPALTQQAGGCQLVVLHEFRQILCGVDRELFVAVREEPAISAARGGFSAAAAALFAAFTEAPMVRDQLIQRVAAATRGAADFQQSGFIPAVNVFGPM